jgi:hypothetical protein
MRKLGLKRLGITLLKKTLGILSCLFFLCSIIFPFCSIVYFGFLRIPEYNGYDSNYYWSFKALHESYHLRWEPPESRTEYWFYENEFYQYMPGPSLSYLLVFMLATQVLTLSTGIASLLFNRRVLALAPLTLCFVVMVLMTYTNTVLLRTDSALYPYSGSSMITNPAVLPGYWFTYPAIMLFLLSFILNIADKKRSITYTPTHAQTQ